MKVRASGYGYTVVEVMIFLAVSGGLFASAVLLVSGQQAKTEFAQAIREIDSQIQDIANDVSTGYYTNTNTFQCSAPPGPGRPNIVTSGSNSQGANTGCIFIGRVLQFSVSGTNGEGFNIYTIVGRQLKASTNKEVENYSDTQPTGIVQGNGPLSTIPNDAFDSKLLTSGLKVKQMKLVGGGNIGAIGFLSTFGSYGGGPDLVSGSQGVDVVPIPTSALNQSTLATADAIATITSATPKNPIAGVAICFESGGTNQYGIVTIGSNGRQLSTKLDIVDKAPLPAECS